LTLKKGGLTQVSCIVEKNGEHDRLNLYINPYSYQKVEEVLAYNLERSNRTFEEVKGYPNQSNQFRIFKKFIEKNLAPTQFLQLAGHNVQKHDSAFLEKWFSENSEYMYNYFSYEHLDTLHLARHMQSWGMLKGCENNKLKTLCQYFGVKLENWHDSMEDIAANRELYSLMRDRITNGKGQKMTTTVKNNTHKDEIITLKSEEHEVCEECGELLDYKHAERELSCEICMIPSGVFVCAEDMSAWYCDIHIANN